MMLMNRYFRFIITCLISLLAWVSCDSDAHLVEYEDVLGAYQGIGNATITVGAKEGLVYPEVGPLNYGDTLLHTLVLPDTVYMVAEVANDNSMSFLTSIPVFQLLNRDIFIRTLSVEGVKTAIKGNHVVTWDTHNVTTSSTVLPLKTLYVPVKNIEINYIENGGESKDIVAQGYVAASFSNYSLEMHLMITDAPGLLTNGCTLWLRYSGTMYSRISSF